MYSLDGDLYGLWILDGDYRVDVGAHMHWMPYDRMSIWYTVVQGV